MSETQTSRSEQWMQGWCRDHGLPNISLSLSCRLQQAIDGYLQWMKDQGYPDSTRDDHQLELDHFIPLCQECWQQCSVQIPSIYAIMVEL